MNKELGATLFFLCIGMLKLQTSASFSIIGQLARNSNVRRSIQYNMRGFATSKNAGDSRASASENLRSLEDFGKGTNTLLYYLKGETEDPKDGSKLYPRQLRKMHFTCVLPEPMPSPYLIAASTSCAKMLELKPSEIATEKFARVFCGNELLPGLDKPFATVYGCHCYGQWFGQLGDGRALSIGEVYTSHPICERDDQGIVKSPGHSSNATPPVTKSPPNSHAISSYGDHIYELQLKGCGRSPFSRGFDGRAVLRSSVREFLVSEAMHHLRLPTTRALSIVGTGQTIARPWYAAAIPCDTNAPGPQCSDSGDTSTDTTATHAQSTASTASCSTTAKNLRGKFPPDKMLAEPGAVLCRVSRSFLRFGQLELFAMRREFDELQQLADYVCFREYPHLLRDTTLSGSENLKEEFAGRPPLPPAPLPTGPPSRYVALFRCVAHRTAQLVADWLRVGYVQGNMNSDNTLLGGRTIDYGPYGWMERYDPHYQPFTSDKSGNFAFIRQPAAMAVNVQVLGKTTIAPLVQHAYTNYLASLPDSDTESSHSANSQSSGAEPVQELESLEAYLAQVQRIHEVEFAQYLTAAYNEVKRCKLGLHSFETTATIGDVNTESDGEEGTDTDQQLWQDLERLMVSSQCDFTILHREMGNVAHHFATYDHASGSSAAAAGVTAKVANTGHATKDATLVVPSSPEISLFPNITHACPAEASTEEPSSTAPAKTATADKTDTVLVGGASGYVVAGEANNGDAQGSVDLRVLQRALEILNPAFYDPSLINADTAPQKQQWLSWLQRYHDRIRKDPLSSTERKQLQDRNNPKFVLRNWMAAVAYDRAMEEDYSVIGELTALLESPYEEQSAELSAKWYTKAPSWAQDLPGVAFMS